MHRIFKYRLEPKRYAEYEVLIPRKARFLSAGVQRGEYVLWYIVDEGEINVDKHTFYVYGTGWQIPEPDKLLFLGTVFEDNFVWHIFEKLWV